MNSARGAIAKSHGTILSDGFTLIEVLVVLVVIGLVAAIAGPVLSRVSSDRQLDIFTENLAAMMVSARSRAIAGSTIVSLRYDPLMRAVQSDVPSRLTVPSDIVLRISQSSGRIPSDVLRFLPDGRSSGGRLELVRNGRVRLIDVARLTGAIRFDAPGDAP